MRTQKPQESARTRDLQRGRVTAIAHQRASDPMRDFIESPRRRDAKPAQARAPQVLHRDEDACAQDREHIVHTVVRVHNHEDSGCTATAAACKAARNARARGNTAGSSPCKHNVAPVCGIE